MTLSKLSKYLLLASFAGTISEQLLMPYWSSFVVKVGGDLFDAGMGYALFSIVTGVFVVTVGQTKWFADHIKPLLVWGFIISGIAEIGYIFVTNKWELFALQTINGISVGILGPCWDALYCSESSQELGKKWSFWSGGVAFIAGISAILSALIVTYWSFQALFITMGIVDAIAVYFAYKATKAPNTSEIDICL
jgi:hypothetical protein